MPLRTSAVYACFGVLFGCLFPILSTGIDLWVHGLAPTFANALALQQQQPLHWIIDTAPFFLGAFAYVAGLRQEAEETANTLLEHRVAELAEAREAAEAANQAKSRFLANVSHELRTPLNAIIGYSEMMIEDAAGAEQTQYAADLSRVHGAGMHLLQLINDVLDLAKVEAGKMDVFIEPTHLPDLIDEVTSTLQTLVAKRHNQLIVSLDDALGSIETDPTKLRQILFNLLSNACKFTSHGRIGLVVRRDNQDNDDWLTFEVSDTGIGIEPEHQARLFEVFDQAKKVHTHEFGSTGLGLAITKRFCELLGGTITAKSVMGEGTTFTVRLPIGVAHAMAVDDLPSAEPTGARTALVIDDEDETHHRLERVLIAEGHTVLHAKGGRAGLKLAREMRPDLITLDIIMPDLDGLSVLKALKSDPDLCDIPVIMVSIMGDRELSIALGAADLITKPFDRDDIAQAIRQHRKVATAQILVVDDDRNARDLLRRSLEADGWTIAEAADGQEAMSILATVRPALVILDLMMPKVDGFALLKWMRSHEDLWDTPVVIVTAKDPTRNELTALRDNVVDILRKGDFDRQRLSADVQRVVAGRTTRIAS